MTTGSIRKRPDAIAAGLLAVGALSIAIGFVVSPQRTWQNLLLDGFYVLSLAVSGIFFICTQRLTSARWSASLRRVPEALMMIMPVAVLLMLPLFFAHGTLFVWSRPGAMDHDPAIAGRVTYLHVPFAFARMLAVLGLWTLFAFLFRRASLNQDRWAEGSLYYHRRLNALAGGFTVLFAITFTSAAYDWVVSLDPRWFTTMIGVYVFAGTFVQGIAAVALATVVLRQRGALSHRVGVHQLHDLGKLLFAFSIFWAYIWTCQYLLSWYADIPEEVTFYASRTNSGWIWLFALNFIINWVVPFLALMSVRGKCTPRRLRAIATLVLAGRWLDLYILVMPAYSPASARLGPLEIGIALGYGALAYLVFRRNLSRAPLEPLHDPVVAADDLAGAHAHS